MEQDTYTTVVIFRKFKEGDIIALFPENTGTLDPNTCDSYQHIGQHGAADVGIIYDTKLATPEEYADLLEELISIGYNPVIYKKYTRKMQERREAALRRYRD